MLGGTTWKVVNSDHLPGCFGACDNAKAVIMLLESLPQDVKEQTFLHELVHAILYSMGKPTDQHDEVFTDGFATFLHQYLKTV